jgi:hypothetical protein
MGEGLAAHGLPSDAKLGRFPTARSESGVKNRDVSIFVVHTRQTEAIPRPPSMGQLKSAGLELQTGAMIFVGAATARAG